MKIKADEVNFFWPSHIKNSANSIKLSIDLSGIRLEITMKTSSKKNLGLKGSWSCVLKNIFLINFNTYKILKTIKKNV